MENVVTAGAVRRKLINYLPYQVREFKGYQGITTGEQPEFELAWNYYEEVFQNQFIDTAGDYGLSRWEKMLGITPKATDSLEVRRARIKARLSLNTPYTVRWLEHWLDGICGTGNHAEIIEDYLFDIQLDYVELMRSNISPTEIMSILMEVLPSNLCWQITSSLKMQSVCYIGGAPGAITRIGIPAAADAPAFSAPLHVGGAFGAGQSFPVPEDHTPPSFTTILRTGGVCTIISNRS